MSDNNNVMIDQGVTTIITQYHVSKGLKVFGDKGTDTVLTKLKQLHHGLVIDPLNATSLLRDDKKAALDYLMFLKQKRCGKVKGRGCADSKKTVIYG